MTDAIKFTKQHADFLGLHWTATAAGKKDVRYYLNYLFVAPDGRAIGSDGHRLHLYRPGANCLEPGYYTVKKLTTAQILLEPAGDVAKYPDFERVLYDVDESALKWIELGTSPDVALYQIVRNLDLCLNFGYVIDTMSITAMSTKSRTSKGKPVTPITLDAARGTGDHPSLYLRHGDKYRAVIAPMNTGEKAKRKAA